MLKIRDRVLLGTVSGLLASLPMLYLVGREAEWGLVNPGQGLLAGRSTAPYGGNRHDLSSVTDRDRGSAL